MFIEKGAPGGDGISEVVFHIAHQHRSTRTARRPLWPLRNSLPSGKSRQGADVNGRCCVDSADRPESGVELSTWQWSQLSVVDPAGVECLEFLQFLLTCVEKRYNLKSRVAKGSDPLSLADGPSIADGES